MPARTVLPVLVLAGGLALAGCDRPAAEPRATLSLVETLGGGDTAGFARAVEPRGFVFPDDHGPHPDFRTEWWYVTANLEAANGRRFGVQFTLFRSALTPEVPASPVAGEPPSAWATNQLYMAHFALADPGAERFLAFERFARGAVGLAGARARPFRAWLEDWALEQVADPAAADAGTSTTAGDPPAGIWPVTLTARDSSPEHAAAAVRLTLTPRKPLVLQGDDGLSRKGPEPGNASYYYSFTRLRAEGEIDVGGERFTVTGTAWLDREWSTSVLSADQVGWDWFALQLDDGRDLMVYQLRGADGSPDRFSAGVVVAPDGTATRLGPDDFTLEPTARWASPIDRSVYPAAWRVRVPAHGLDLDVTPVLADQELDLSFRYWEGAVDVASRNSAVGNPPITGRGYAELTGYSGGGPPSNRMRTR